MYDLKFKIKIATLKGQIRWLRKFILSIDFFFILQNALCRFISYVFKIIWKEKLILIKLQTGVTDDC